MLRGRRLAVSPSQFRWFAYADLAATVAIVLTGAAVRLTGSGLGCPDWPTCHSQQLTGPLPTHAVIEYGNRAFTGLLIVVTALSCLAAWWRTPRRRDLLWLNGGLVAGIVADALLGALVVYSKLNPWLVGLHMVLALALVADAATLAHRAVRRCGPADPSVTLDPHLKRLARWTWVPFAAVVLSGVVTTGAGPHAGNTVGQQVAKRVPIAFDDATWIHSVAATAFVALVLGALFVVWRPGTPMPLRSAMQRLAAAAALQGVIGITQYWLHVPVALVELHVFGAVALTIGVTQLNLRQVAREREVAPAARAVAVSAPAD